MAFVSDYVLGHRQSPPGVGLLVLGEDFGTAAPPAPPADSPTAYDYAVECIRVLDEARFVTRGRDVGAAFDQIGSIADYLQRIAELTDPKGPPAPGPEPPAPGSLSGAYGTYPGHGKAVDWYGGYTEDQVNWGPHHGLPIVAPVDGRVEVYNIGTPLSVGDMAAIHALGSEYVMSWLALAEGWTCRASPLQTMFIAVFWPSAALVIEGQRIGHLHYGHVRSDIKAGDIRAGEQFATSWNSGIQFEPGNPVARAAHVHCCAGAGATLSPNGDLPGRLAVVAQGWRSTDIGTVPGPTDYQTPNLWCAGRRYQDFVTSGHAIPAMPA